MTGAKGSGMDRTDLNECLFYTAMMQAEIEKERCRIKICLSDKLLVVAFLPLPHSSGLVPGAPQLRGHHALHSEEAGRTGQEAETSSFQVQG